MSDRPVRTSKAAGKTAAKKAPVKKARCQESSRQESCREEGAGQESCGEEGSGQTRDAATRAKKARPGPRVKSTPRRGQRRHRRRVRLRFGNAATTAQEHLRGPALLPHQRRADPVLRRDPVQPARPRPLGAQLLLHHLLRRLGRRASTRIHPEPQAVPGVRERRGDQQLAADQPRGARLHRRPHTPAVSGPRSRWCSSTARPRRSARNWATT